MFDFGGLYYMVVFFNGWYMVIEIATRNFCDESWYNFVLWIVKVMGIDMFMNEILWKDYVFVVINYVVLYFFKCVCVSIVDYYTCVEFFA